MIVGGCAGGLAVGHDSLCWGCEALADGLDERIWPGGVEYGRLLEVFCKLSGGNASLVLFRAIEGEVKMSGGAYWLTDWADVGYGLH